MFDMERQRIMVLRQLAILAAALGAGPDPVTE